MYLLKTFHVNWNKAVEPSCNYQTVYVAFIVIYLFSFVVVLFYGKQSLSYALYNKKDETLKPQHLVVNLSNDRADLYK